MIAQGIVELTKRLRKEGKHITIETAGTVYAPVECDLMSISPKLANSTPQGDDAGTWKQRHETLRLQPEVLSQLIDKYHSQVKFVVTLPTDMDEIRTIVDMIGAKRSEVILMAEGTDPKILAERGHWLVESCKENGFRFSPRLHVDLWGQKRGV